MIYCCECKKDIDPRLTNGKEIYPKREDLHTLPFWKCDVCKNYVGCHHKTKTPTKPLGCIPNKEIKKARMEIHKLIDPWWKSGRVDRRWLYSEMSMNLGYEYHTANIRDIEEARRIYRSAKEILAQAINKEKK